MFDFDESEKSTVNLKYIKILHSYEWRNEKKNMLLQYNLKEISLISECIQLLKRKKEVG